MKIDNADKRSATDFDSLIGRRIKAARALANVTGADLCNDVQISAYQLHKYESGKNRVPASRLYQISKALGVDVTFFFCDEKQIIDEHDTGDVRLVQSIYDVVKNPKLKRKLHKLIDDLMGD